MRGPYAAPADQLPEIVCRAAPGRSVRARTERLPRQALAAAMSDPLTVVTGPARDRQVPARRRSGGQPVAGGAVRPRGLHEQRRRRRGGAAMRTIDEALLIRTGNRERRDELPQVLEQLAARGAQPGPSTGVIRRQLEAAAASRQQVQQRLAERHAMPRRSSHGSFSTSRPLRAMLWGSPAPSPVHERRQRGPHARRARHRSRWWRARRDTSATSPLRQRRRRLLRRRHRRVGGDRGPPGGTGGRADRARPRGSRT